MSQEKISQHFMVTGLANLEVNNIRGSVTIEPGEDGVIAVTAIKHTHSGDAARTVIKLLQEEDGTVKASAHFPEESLGWLFGGHPCKVDFTITAPRQVSLKVKGVSNDATARGFSGNFNFRAVSGDITLSDLDGDVTIHTVSGNVELSRVAGKLDLTTVSGNVHGQKTSGNLHLATTSGNLHLKESQVPAVESRSVSGQVNLQTPLGAGPYNFHSVSGEVELKVPAESHLSAELHSISGHISTNLPTSASTRNHGNHAVEVQGGGVKVTLQSVSGELSLVS